MIAEVYEENGEAYINLPPEVVPTEWLPGTHLAWTDNGDGSWTVSRQKTDFVDSVVEFNQVVNNHEPQAFDARKVALYIGLILEEAEELLDALHTMDTSIGSLRGELTEYSNRFKKGAYDSYISGMDRVEALDAFVDIAVVTLGGANAMGARVQDACREVMNSNMSKFPMGEDGKRYALRDANGKVIKGPDYEPPSLAVYA